MLKREERRDSEKEERQKEKRKSNTERDRRRYREIESDSKRGRLRAINRKIESDKEGERKYTKRIIRERYKEIQRYRKR